jgi:hypothetical protein
MRSHGGQQIRFVEFESFAEFKPECAAGKISALQAKLEHPGWLIVKVAAFRDRLESQAGLGSGGLKRCDKSGFQFDSH